jgi:putative ABC transport system ATP-binding protein
MHICQFEGVGKDYAMGEVTVHALADIDLTIDTGEFTVFAGPSGSGKTTLLNLVGLLDAPTHGTLRMEGQNTSQMSMRTRGQTRAKRIGFIFQNFNLIPVLTAYENVELAIRLSSSMAASERRDRVENALNAVGIGDLMDRRPRQMSGGQQQRVAIARALVKAPALVIADEPTANLDSKNGSQILALMEDLNAEHGATFLFSTHDPMVMDHARRIVYLRDGRIERIQDKPGRDKTPSA